MARKDVPDQLVCMAVATYKVLQEYSEIFGTPPWERPRQPYPDEILASITGEPRKVCYRAMERAHRRGLIQYGVSLRTGWLTDAGLALIHA